MVNVLSIQEPWAFLILKGAKDVELRTWRTFYRGRLYIHVTKNKMNTRTRDVFEAAQVFDYTDDLRYPPGHICGYVTLTAVRRYNSDAAFLQDRPRHRFNGDMYAKPLYGFIMEDAHRIEPVRARGQLMIWRYDLAEDTR